MSDQHGGMSEGSPLLDVDSPTNVLRQNTEVEAAQVQVVEVVRIVGTAVGIACGWVAMSGNSGLYRVFAALVILCLAVRIFDIKN